MQTDLPTRVEPSLGPSAAYPTAPALPAAEPVQFTGSGGEYFGIWIVNLLLTVLTLGIYSAWAKVRRLKYFYQHTRLAGAGFDYHGDPVAILKGRLIGLGLVMAYNFSTQISWKLFALTLLLLLVVMPWLLRQSFRFRMTNSSYRGLRFRFSGSTGGAYRVFLGNGLLMFLTLYLAGPLFHQRLKQYQHGNTWYGQAPFSFHAGVGAFYRAYLPIILFTVLIFILAFASVGVMSLAVPKGNGNSPDPQAMLMMTSLLFAVLIGGFLMLQPLWEARLQNLIWNNTRLGEHRFHSDISAWRLFLIMISNLIMMVLTLGFFMPWAVVSLARYRASTLQLLPAGPLDEFLATQEAAVTATGEETAEFFDIDIGL